MSKKKKNKKKSIFNTCFSCFSRVPIECDDFTCPAFGYDGSDFEYIIENMSIKKVPKKLLTEPLVSPKNIEKNVYGDFSGYVVKKVPPEVSIAPVTELVDAYYDVSSSEFKDSKSSYELIPVAAPICKTCDDYTPPKRPGVAKTFHAQTKHVFDSGLIKELLTPHSMLNKDKLQKQVLADIHKSNEEEDNMKHTQAIPPEIKEAIEALKVAKPLHNRTQFSPKHHRGLHGLSSNTSCDKETSGNFSVFADDIIIKEEKPQKTPKTKRKHMPPDKIDASSSTSDFPDAATCFKNVSSDLQSSEKTQGTDSFQGQSLKWKIIINKHEESNMNNKRALKKS